MFNLLYDESYVNNATFAPADGRIAIWERDAHYLYFGNEAIGYFHLPQPWTYYIVHSVRYDGTYQKDGYDKLYGLLVSPVRITDLEQPGWFPTLTNTYGSTQCTPINAVSKPRDELKDEDRVEILNGAYSAWASAEANFDGRWYYDKVFHAIANRIGIAPINETSPLVGDTEAMNEYLASVFGYLEGLSLHQIKRTLWREFDPDTNSQDPLYKEWSKMSYLLKSTSGSIPSTGKLRVLDSF